MFSTVHHFAWISTGEMASKIHEVNKCFKVLSDLKEIQYVRLRGLMKWMSKKLYEKPLQKALLMLIMLVCVKWCTRDCTLFFFYVCLWMSLFFPLRSASKQHLSSSREHTSAIQPLPSPEPHSDLHCQRRQACTIGKSNLLHTHITNHIRVILIPPFPQVNSEVYSGALLNTETKDPVLDCFTV